MILGADHAQITVPRGEEERAREFYCGVLGLREIPKPPELQGRGGFWLQLSNLQIHVGIEDGFDRGQTKAHVAYLVDDLERMRELLRAQGITEKESIPLAGMDRFECRDPFGNRMEFIQR